MNKGSLLVKKAGINLYQRRSLFLGIGSLIGLGATAVLTAKGQMAADQILKERNDACKNPSDNAVYPPSKKEVFDLTWQCYIPAGLAFLATTGCIIGNQYISAKEIAALTGSIAFLTANRDQMENMIKDKYGEEGLNELKKRLSLRKPETEKEIKVIKSIAEETGFGDLLCFEGYSGKWFRCSADHVKNAEKEFSKEFREGNYLCLNDLYDLFGVSPTHFGNQFGWAASEDYYDVEDGIEFANTLVPARDSGMGEDVMYIDIFTYPMEGWMEV